MTAQNSSPQSPRPTRETAAARSLVHLMREFLDTESAGGVVLLAASVLALVMANTPISGTFESLWHTVIDLPLGPLTVSGDLRHWINDGLMAIFFFVVGLEIKQELVAGELHSPRKAALPVVAAMGGMIVPAIIYAVWNAGTPGSSGWGIPMATDIAFAVGALSLLGPRVPSGLKVFLLTLAIVDDIGAILVIALFYSEGVALVWLSGAGAVLLLTIPARRAGSWFVLLFASLGMVAWYCTLRSGVHATIAGVALALLVPARPDETGSVAERLAHALHPWSSFAIVPLFALANAGFTLTPASVGSALGSRVAAGVTIGLVGGKLLGITCSTWLAVRLHLGVLPDGVGWRHVVGAAAVAGIGFTVSLFVANIAFSDPELIERAKVGILLGSFTAAVLGILLLRAATRPAGEVLSAEQLP